MSIDPYDPHKQAQEEMESKAFWAGAIIGICAGIVFLTLINFAFGKTPPQMKAKFQADAVRLGYGEYLPSESNEPVFRWKKQ